MKRIIIALTSLGCVAAIGPTAQAQDANDEIIVTGSRISSYQNDIVPVIHMTRRADFMIVKVGVESDSRDYKLRRSEVMTTLGALADRADRDQSIELGIVRTFETDDDEMQFIERFDRSAIRDEILRSGGRTDTTRATIVVKTPIGASDSYDNAHQRISKFVAETGVSGRATIVEQDDPGLSIVDIAQYRAPLLRLLAADNDAVRAAFGEAYRVSVAGLEQPVRWRVTGPLDLALYFPYESSIAPR